MISQSVFQRRRLEIFFAAQTTLFGMWLMLPFVSMAGPSFAMVLTLAPERDWGLLFFFNGCSHALALLVNGRRWWSPFVRWFAAMVTMLAYAALSVCFAQIVPTSTAVANYGLFVIGAGMCMFTAWQDARLAMRLRNAALAYA